MGPIEENHSHSQSAPPQAAEMAATPPSPAEPAPETKASPESIPAVVSASPEGVFTSTGKRLHNEFTYRGVDWLVNAAIGVTFTYVTAKTRIGQEYWSNPLNGFFSNVMKKFTRNPGAIKEGSKWGTLFASIMAGGTAIIPPMLVLENKQNKKAIIKTIDEKVYGKEAVESDPKFQECYDAIDNEPKKSFAVGMAARVIALAPLIGITMAPNLNKYMVQNIYTPIGKGTKAICKAVGIQPQKMMTEGVMDLAEGDISKKASWVTNWDFLHRTIGFDVGLTFFYSFLHEGAMKALASFGLKRTKDVAGSPAEPASPNPESALLENASPDPARPKASILPASTHSRHVHKRTSYQDELIHQPETAISDFLRH